MPALALLALLADNPQAGAQSNPNIAEFLPSAEHSQTLPGGQPAVTSYELLVYQAGAFDPYLRVNLGKPAAQADGLIRVNFGASVAVWPLPNTSSEARVVAHGPGGMGVSNPSGTFVYQCTLTLSPAAQTFAAAGGTGSVQVTTPSSCGRSAVSSAAWVAITSGSSGAGSGPVAYTVDPNTTTASRVATLTIGSQVFTVNQAAGGGGSGGVPPGETRYLSDLPWASMTNGWGPVEKNRSNGEQGSNDGAPLTVNGLVYARGLGGHAASDVRFALNGTCSAFLADVGMDDEVGSNGSVVFRVLGDGAVLFDSGVVNGTTPTRGVTVAITGVRDLALVMTNGGDNANYDHGDWADARVICDAAAPPPVSTTRYLSDLPWLSATNGWGAVERDRSNGEQGSADGRTLTLNARTYAKGLGAHADSSIRYALNSTCSRFQASVGIDDEIASGGSVLFQVWADGTKLYDSGRMTASTATKTVDVNLSTRRELTLVVTTAGDGATRDHGDWAEARITCAP